MGFEPPPVQNDKWSTGGGYEFAVANHDGMRALLLVEQRSEDALTAVAGYLEGRHEETLRVLALGTRAKVHLLRDENDLARQDLEAAEDLVDKSQVIPPWHLSALTTAQLRYFAGELIAGRSRSVPRKVLRRATQVADRVAGARPETYRLIGHIEWARGNAKGSEEWWGRAISTGESLGAEPELFRALTDSARCWKEADSKGLQQRAETHAKKLNELSRGIDFGFDSVSSAVVS